MSKRGTQQERRISPGGLSYWSDHISRWRIISTTNLNLNFTTSNPSTVRTPHTGQHKYSMAQRSPTGAIGNNILSDKCMPTDNNKTTTRLQTMHKLSKPFHQIKAIQMDRTRPMKPMLIITCRA